MHNQYDMIDKITILYLQPVQSGHVTQFCNLLSESEIVQNKMPMRCSLLVSYMLVSLQSHKDKGLTIIYLLKGITSVEL